MIQKITSFIDRNYNLIFRKKDCVSFIFQESTFGYNDIIFDGQDNLRCLGKDWYIKLQNK